MKDEGSAGSRVLERSSDEMDQVAGCAAAYARALARHDEAQTLASADDVLAARASLIECLVRTGWLPPPQAMRTWTQDLLLLHERDDREVAVHADAQRDL